MNKNIFSIYFYFTIELYLDTVYDKKKTKETIEYMYRRF